MEHNIQNYTKLCDIWTGRHQVWIAGCMRLLWMIFRWNEMIGFSMLFAYETRKKTRQAKTNARYNWVKRRSHLLSKHTLSHRKVIDSNHKMPIFPFKWYILKSINDSNWFVNERCEHNYDFSFSDLLNVFSVGSMNTCIYICTFYILVY